MNDIKEQKTTGVLYKLCCKDITVKEIYVGSTTNFRSRKYEHKHRTHKEGSKFYDMKVYKYIRDNGGWINWDMIQIEEYEYTNKRDLHKRERHFLEELKATLNIQMPTRGLAESCKAYRDNNKELLSEKAKHFYLANKDVLCLRTKLYKEENKEKLNIRHKTYREKNREKIAIRQKEYYKNNAEKINKKNREKSKIKFTCDCGAIIVYGSKFLHLKSKKHKFYETSLTTV